MGKVESNGVYVGKSGYLMEEFKAPDQTQYDATVKAMTDFAQKHSDLKQYALIAPNSVNILSDRLPAFAPVQDQNSWLDSLSASLTDAGVTFIDVRSTFKDHKMEDLYYHTDHHWTTQGCLLYTSDAADEEDSVDLGGCRHTKKKKKSREGLECLHERNRICKKEVEKE